jgi:hypothetical protein
MRRYLEQYRTEFIRVGGKAEAADAEAWGSLSRILMAANEFVYID